MSSCAASWSTAAPASLVSSSTWPRPAQAEPARQRPRHVRAVPEPPLRRARGDGHRVQGVAQRRASRPGGQRRDRVEAGQLADRVTAQLLRPAAQAAQPAAHGALGHAQPRADRLGTVAARRRSRRRADHLDRAAAARRAPGRQQHETDPAGRAAGPARPHPGARAAQQPDRPLAGVPPGSQPASAARAGQRPGGQLPGRPPGIGGHQHGRHPGAVTGRGCRATPAPVKGELVLQPRPPRSRRPARPMITLCRHRGHPQAPARPAWPATARPMDTMAPSTNTIIPGPDAHHERRSRSQPRRRGTPYGGTRSQRRDSGDACSME